MVIKGGTRARKKDTKVPVNGMIMARKVVMANQLQIIIKILLANMNLLKDIHVPQPNRLQLYLVVDSKRQQWLKREN